jgi:hypothetical protein
MGWVSGAGMYLASYYAYLNLERNLESPCFPLSLASKLSDSVIWTGYSESGHQGINMMPVPPVLTGYNKAREYNVTVFGESAMGPPCRLRGRNPFLRKA